MSTVLRDIADLAATIEGMRAARPRASGRLIVGLAGAPGTGKSTIAAALSAELPGSVVLPMDGFHLPQAELVALGRRDRMGAPDTFDANAFVALLETLREHGWHRVAPLLDLSVGIELDEATRHERLIARHIAFGKTPDAARAWALGPDERNAAAIAATLERADYLLNASTGDSSAGSSTR